MTYAVPFETVWQSALHLASGGLRRWRLEHADDTEGVLRAQAARLTGAAYHVEVRISLDDNAQTRVDASAEALDTAWDLGTAVRLLRRFFRALDVALQRAARRSPSR